MIMKPLSVVGSVLIMLALGGCGSQPDVRQNLRSWKGQTDTALTGTFGYPQKTLDLQGGKKVYHYDFDKGCAVDFEIDTHQIISDVKVTGSDLSTCPHKLPGGGSF
jgi:hypothetical protein